jgi:hypothetical protein
MPDANSIEIWRVVFTGVAAAAAIAAVVVSLAARRNARRSAEAAERSAAAAQRSAVAGERSAAAAEEAVKHAHKAAATAAEGTRARIVCNNPDHAETSVKLDDPSKVIFWLAVNLENTGRIPAFHRKSRHSWRMTERFAWPEPTSEASTAEEKPPLPPGTPDTIREIIEIGPSEFQAIHKGSVGLYVFGIEEYETLREKHRMTWCVRYQPQSKQFTYRADLSDPD